MMIDPPQASAGVAHLVAASAASVAAGKLGTLLARVSVGAAAGLLVKVGPSRPAARLGVAAGN